MLWRSFYLPIKNYAIIYLSYFSHLWPYKRFSCCSAPQCITSFRNVLNFDLAALKVFLLCLCFLPHDDGVLNLHGMNIKTSHKQLPQLNANSSFEINARTFISLFVLTVHQNGVFNCCCCLNQSVVQLLLNMWKWSDCKKVDGIPEQECFGTCFC